MNWVVGEEATNGILGYNEKKTERSRVKVRN